jgi:Fe-S cluster assembly iron-binding protein IscA
VIEFTQRAVEVLRAADAGARRFNPDARIRVRRAGAGVTFELTDEASSSDEVVDAGGCAVLVERGLAGTVDAGEHGVLTLSEAR